MRQFISKSANETIQLGKKLIDNLPKSYHVILLNGDLSSGKTTFTKGIGKALGITSVINSPTFTILKTYQGTKTLNHLDLYRMDGIGLDFDLEDYILDEDAISVIEWPSQVEELIPQKHVLVELKWLNETDREIKISTSDGNSDWIKKI
ncbi:tRNA (adenosine(37)-N6)-threonylcarbamoyltransferase complex ATPase subunit type 1 TsaE [Acholeplasma laidlawii]|jgi:tRNA threonylcarbamoyladenosine biosynthesis protein TsaE|uniref:tRNA threonylcarbamoyladenosine biosynthesis protein TsaE n=2 Tax=Acholeplasma laidlawii TaxID=2148 RepID=A9NHW9_ACHLI|nr:tRNA (adenosine(37)-N6)-threonylcarbamoyltransferase complex ATPase subunit type 1 TsaE [Acholeplasma laidlawii]ABX81949.1 predicted ATPase [Acholeplasma laidlawii PG-8A]NWH10931.1 tRNA (adenosine(37)-N6)-threonylcarbamoyltransferase complex ATPase subunit type 1 TsaE [Acholeplasma laidlawii]NWH12317.1 tRNA (adenosine(37)-N6)-threonylcarbamoyltransferase complex ATPase subunit type 1 TsaE [Acholeplasma laidlawii]NWH13703.1 tRNA (adenosine(37)-N6)-threonylcarbamoyltransferase complex ATPase s